MTFSLGTLADGAKNAVEVCMAVKQGENVLVLTDRETAEVGRALFHAADRASHGHVKILVLEDYTPRPAKEMPKQILETIPWANVTFYAATSKQGELSIRGPFLQAAKKYARHAHMPSVTKEVMETGMCADYEEISRLTRKLDQVVKHGKKARVSNASGTELEIKFNPSWRWKVSDGLHHTKGMWGNLPDGEIFTAPFKVDGKMVVDELGDWFSPKYGVLTESPVTLSVKDSRVDLSSITCTNDRLRQELVTYLSEDPNGNRMGEFAIGTNAGLKKLTGILLQDEKFPTVHCAFGFPYGDETGADWDARTHVDCIMLKCSIWIDGKLIMDEGKHLVN